MKTADAILAESAKTFKARRAVYGDNWKRAGAVMAAMFPDGIVLRTADDHNSFHIFSLMVVKLTRYAVSLDRGEFHQDSIHDNTVYSAMLEMIELSKPQGAIRHANHRHRPKLRADRKRSHQPAKSHRS